MFGFVIGTLCLIGLIKVARGMRRGYYGHHGYGHGYGRWGGGRASRRRWALRWAFRRLATTPAQEKVILDAADALDAEREKLHEELRAAKGDLASALRAEPFDEAKVRAAFERQQTVLSNLQEAALNQAKKVAEVLQPDQRKLIADVLENGPRALHGGGCGYGYRGGCGEESSSCGSTAEAC